MNEIKKEDILSAIIKIKLHNLNIFLEQIKRHTLTNSKYQTTKQ